MATRTEYEFLVRMGAQMDKSITSTASKVTKTIAGIFGAKAIISGAKKLAGYVYQVGTESIDLASALETSVVNAANVFGGTAAQVEANEKEIQSFSRTLAYDMPYSAKETADSLYYLGLAGVDLSNSMETVGDMMKLAYVAGEDVSTVVDLVTDSMSALGMEINGSNTTKYLNEVATVMATTNTNATMAMETILKFGGAAGAVGLSLEESVAMLGAMANYGVKAEEAGTLLNSALVRMTSNSTAQKAYAAAGIQLYDENGNFAGAIDVLEQLNEKRKTWNDQKSDAYFADMFGTRAYSRMLYMLDALEKGKDGISDYEEILKGIEESDGRLNQMWENQTDTFDAKVKVLKGQIDYMKEDIGFALIPAAEEAMGWVQEKFYPSMQEGAQGLADFINTEITPNVTSFLDLAYEKGQAFAEKLISAGQAAQDYFSSDEWERLCASAEGFASAVVTSFEETNWTLVVETAASIGNGFISAATAVATIGETLTNIWNSPFIKFFRNVLGLGADALGSLGSFMLEGFNRGTSAVLNPVNNWLESLGDPNGPNEALLDDFSDRAAETKNQIDSLSQQVDVLEEQLAQETDAAMIQKYQMQIDQLNNSIMQAQNSLVSLQAAAGGTGNTQTGTASSFAPAGGFKKQTISPFASGGIVTEPTLGIIGEAGENEAVIPLSKIGQVMRSMGGNGGGNITYAPVFQISGRADAETIKAAARDAYAEFKANYARLQKETARRAF